MGETSLEIGVAEPHERRAALELVLRGVAAGARQGVVDAVASQPPQLLGPLDALIVARRQGVVAAATWAQPSPGSAAGLWPPEAVDEAAAVAGDALVAAALRTVDAVGVAMTQALFDTPDDPRIAIMRRAGFERVAELLYLGRSLRAADASRFVDAEVRFEPYRESEYERLKRAIAATYVGTLDCPAMEGRRNPDDVLTGYRATGNHDPNDWFFVRDAGQEADLGVLLLTEHPASQQFELVYMGLAPPARGVGLGKAIVDQAIGVASRRGAEQLMVAVDRANSPARKVYEAAGFAMWAEKQVYVR